jgi:hypothetical protein
MRDDLIYLACPYSAPDNATRRIRWVQSADAAAWLVRQGKVVFSPITHSDPIARIGDIDPLDFEVWNRQNEVFMTHADVLYVLALEGWQKSKGIQAEVKNFQQQGKPVYMLRPVKHQTTRCDHVAGYTVVPYGQRGRTPGMKVKGKCGRPCKVRSE